MEYRELPPLRPHVKYEPDKIQALAKIETPIDIDEDKFEDVEDGADSAQPTDSTQSTKPTEQIETLSKKSIGRDSEIVKVGTVGYQQVGDMIYPFNMTDDSIKKFQAEFRNIDVDKVKQYMQAKGNAQLLTIKNDVAEGTSRTNRITTKFREILTMINSPDFEMPVMKGSGKKKKKWIRKNFFSL
jgi:hypothetical protein